MGLKEGTKIKQFASSKYPSVFHTKPPPQIADSYCDYSGTVHPTLAYMIKNYSDISTTAAGFLDGFQGRYKCARMFVLMETPGAIPLAKNPCQRERDQGGFDSVSADNILTSFQMKLPQAVEPDKETPEFQRKSWYRMCLATRPIKSHIFHTFTDGVFQSYSRFDRVTVLGRERGAAFTRYRDSAWERSEHVELPPEGEGKIVPAMIMYAKQGSRVVATGRDGDILAALLLRIEELEKLDLDVWWDTDMNHTFIHISELARLMRRDYGQNLSFIAALWLMEGCDTIDRPPQFGWAKYTSAFPYGTLHQYFQYKNSTVSVCEHKLRQKLHQVYRAWPPARIDVCLAHIRWTLIYFQCQTLTEVPDCTETKDGISVHGWIRDDQNEGYVAELVKV